MRSFEPEEPVIPVTISPPSPPFGGEWADRKITYSGERLLEFRHVKDEVLADYEAAQAEHNARALAFDEAWETARKEGGLPTPEEIAAHRREMQEFHHEQLDLDRAALLAQVRYMVWAIRNDKGVIVAGGPDQIGWDTIPTAGLLWLAARGMVKAREELDGPLPLR